MAASLYHVPRIKLTYQSTQRPADRPLCATSALAYELLVKLWDPGRMELQEEFKVLYLDRQLRCLGVYRASSGGTTGTLADVKLIYAAALLSRAESLILAHNHPSGTRAPSAADVTLTRRFSEVGRVLTVPVQDHLILTRYEGYYSFADHGLLEE